MIARLRVGLARVAGLLRRRAGDERLNEEVAEHLELLAERYEESGMSPKEARLAAQREFGGLTLMREEHREQRGMPWLESCLRDLTLATRSLWKDRSLAALCVLSLGLAIGATTAIFSMYEAAVLRPLPFPNAQQLVFLFESSKSGRQWASLPNIEDWRERNGVLAEVAALSMQTMALSGGGTAERVRGGFVSEPFFRLLGVNPRLGRLDLPRGEAFAVISHRLWMRRFQSDPGIAGTPVVLNGEAYAIAGVLPASFVFPLDDIDVWVPAERYATSMQLARDLRTFAGLGRLREDVSLPAARENLQAIASNLAREYPKENAGFTATLLPFRDYLAEGVRGTLVYLLAAGGILMLVACANVSGLLAARATQRQRQFALQAALGASRGRLVRQMLAEGLSIGMCGGLVGALIAWLATGVLPSILPEKATFTGLPSVNSAVLVFCIGISVAAGLLAALLPSLGCTQGLLDAALREGGDRLTAGRAGRLREGFLVVQVSAAMLLLVGSGTLASRLHQLMNADLGIANSDKVLTMEYRVSRAKFASRAQQWDFHRRVVEGVRAIPGVRAAGLARAVPYSGNGGTVDFQPPDGAPLRAAEAPRAVFNTITDGYLDAMGIPLLRGRTCTDQDVDGGPVVIMVNDRLAARLWPAGNALGQTLAIRDWATATVVGVVGGNRQNDIRDDPPWQIYSCYSQNPGTLAAIAMRVSGDIPSLASAAQSVVWRIDGDQAVWKIRTMRSLVDLQTRDQRTIASLSALFALFSSTLALAGVYGIVSYNLGRRAREIGIRRALGASAVSILRVMLRRYCFLVIAGIAIGALASAVVESPSPMIVAGCGASALVAAGCASLLPGLRAMRTNPVEVLRQE